MVTDPLLSAVLAGAMDVTRRAVEAPAVLRAHPATVHRLLLASKEHHDVIALGNFGPRHAVIPDYFDTRPSVLGIAMENDDYLPEGAFRLCDEYGTLLLDSREGTHAL